MSTMQTWRKAYGSLKDQTKVGLVDVNSDFKVAIKTLIVIHRTLREGDPTFREELVNFPQRGCVLQLGNFKDDSNPTGWDCSAWVRTYGLLLEERLECFRVLKYDIEAEKYQYLFKVKIISRIGASSIFSLFLQKPKIAVVFLVRNRIPLDLVWDEFFQRLMGESNNARENCIIVIKTYGFTSGFLKHPRKLFHVSIQQSVFVSFQTLIPQWPHSLQH
ncbi:hypothetical protein L2E82_38556 [Cichorium intybus]|uniref:Uncharacterized protein n=1 Tax=Cichorium intybus TaxID=13427 RepID=A0ACB9AFE1_CICIN|nr:hypothetical protein L2E82_38556 [Cichorium intybus]